MEQNPYAPPGYDVPSGPAGPAGPADDEGFIEGGRGVEAGQGYQWLAGGWEIVKGNVGSWIVICILYMVIAVLISVIPVVGRFVFNLMAPMFSAGLLLGCRDIREGRSFGVGHLFEGFKHASGLVVLGLVNLVWALVLGGLGVVMGAGGAFMARPKLGAVGGAGLDPAMLQKLFLFSAVAFVIGIPITMANYYAPALVALKGLSPVAALKNSFLGAAKNVLPFIVYSIIATLFTFVALLPCGLGLLVYLPGLGLRRLPRRLLRRAAAGAVAHVRGGQARGTGVS